MSSGVAALDLPQHSDASLKGYLAEIDRDRPDAILVSNTPENFTFRHLIVELVNAAKIPAIYTPRDYIEAGGLMAYASDIVSLFRHAAHQISMILRGRPIAEVPFYQNDKLELIINRKVADAQGITIPPHLLSAADEVVE